MNPELESFEQMPTRGLEASSTQRRQSEQGLTIELDAAERLHQVATQLITARGTDALFEKIVDAAVSILNCDFASLQMLYPERGTNGELRLLCHRGFNP